MKDINNSGTLTSGTSANGGSMKAISNRKRILALLAFVCLVSIVLLLLGRSGKNSDDTAAFVGEWDAYLNGEYEGDPVLL